MSPSSHHTLTDEVFVGGGEMGARMRALDWSRTPLGPLEAWPQSLRTAVGIVLGTRHPMLLMWGPDLVQFYNDAFGLSLGPDRQPTALGQRARECWAEIWEALEPQFDAIMQRGEATWHEDHLVPITRGDRVEDVYWSYSYSPVWAEDRRVGGILVTVQETTKRVLAERRSRVLGELAAFRPGTPSDLEVLEAATAILRQVPRDLPFAALYVRDEETGRLCLSGQVGADPGESPWPVCPSPEEPAGRVLEETLERMETVLLEDVAALPGAREAALAADMTPPPQSALLVPIPRGESTLGPHGVLVAGLSSRTTFDREYQDFLTAAAAQIGRNLTAARADAATRHRADTLSAEAQRLADLLEQAPGFLAVLRGPDHVFEVVNPGYRALVGQRALIGRAVREVFPDLESVEYFDLLDRVLETGEPYRATGAAIKLRLTPDGPLTQLYLDFIFQRVEGAPDTPPGIFVYGFDATERHEFARALAASERRHRLLVESIPQVVWIADREGRLEYVSPHAVWAESGGESLTLEQRFTQHLHPADAAAAIEAWRRAVDCEDTFEIEVRARQPDGTEQWYLSRATPFRDEETGELRWFGTSTDIDALKRTEEQLRDTQRLQAVGTLAGGVAHEINNQMTSVLGFGEFVLRALGPEHAQAADMRVVLQSAERAARISQELLAFSRQQVTERRRLDLAALVVDLEPVLVQLLGSDKHLTIRRTSGPATVPQVSADPGQVQQVLVNLVANARDATETGGRVDIALEDVTLDAPVPAPLGESIPAGRYVRLDVADTGCGIPDETLGRIFDPFFTTKAIGAGTGLGLSMVHGTLRRHGGYVRVRSAPGAGTTFELYWPVTEAVASPETGRALGQEPAATSAPARVVVLVVEDEPNVRALAARVLRGKGYEVEEACDGQAALALIEQAGSPPDAVVTDVVMPNLNGRQLYEALRERWPDLPVLFMSGHTGESDIYRRMVPRGAPFLQKPFTPAGLAEAVAGLVAVGGSGPGGSQGG